MASSKRSGTRVNWLDATRGAAVILMIIYHTCWDLVFLFGHHIGWFANHPDLLLNRIICFSFILISGYSVGLSRQILRRGVIVFLCGAAITVVTLVFTPNNPIWFGILTFIGSAMLIMAVLDKGLKKAPAIPGIIICLFLFVLFYHVIEGRLSFFTFPVATISKGLYKNYITAYLGFPFKGFISEDYFSILPWIFLYMTGYFAYQATSDFAKKTAGPIRKWGLLSLLGRYSLQIYIVHQGVIFVVLKILNWAGII
ncbi:MAG: DUF1624 domain-containing protein [Lachnospiraceae bacterium]|nr:DUF1624 domain-containing protein [Lachnospiraceae bacterium]